MKRRRRLKYSLNSVEGHKDFIQVVKYKKNGKVFKRKYTVAIYFATMRKQYVAYFGWTDKKGIFKNLYIRYSSGIQDMWENMMVQYKNHLSIVTGKVKLYRIKQSILDDGSTALESNGEAMSSTYWRDTFKLIKRDKEADFDMHLLDSDGNTHIVSGECMERVRPDFY